MLSRIRTADHLRLNASLRLAALLLLAATITEAQPQTGATPQQRYDAARRLMQQNKFDAAAENFRAVADSDEAPLALRAQALVAAGLMYENNRQYETAAESYQEARRRFPGTEYARRAEAALNALEVGGPQRGIEFRRRQDAVWDELFPAQAEAARGDWASARPKLERATAHLSDILRDFRQHPKARDIAIALGNAEMLLEDYPAAQSAYREAIAITQEQAADSGPGLTSILLDAQERLHEAVRSWRRLWIVRSAWALLAVIAALLLVLRPWRAVDADVLLLASRLGLGALLLSAVAALASYVVRNYVDEHSPIEDRAAALLVGAPGIIAVIASLGYALGLRISLRWSDTSVAAVAAVVSAIAAVAVAALVINAFALFPILDSDL